MSAGMPVLIAIGPDADETRYLTDVWAPAFAEAGLRAESLWCPVTDDAPARPDAGRLADLLGVDLAEGETTEAAAVFTTARGPAQVAAVAVASELGIPVLLESPVSDPADELAALIEKAPARMLSGHHLRRHPGFTRVVTAVRNAEIGLLRAVALDLVTSGRNVGQDAARMTTRTLRELGGHAIDLVRTVTGPATLGLQAHHSASGSWTLLGQSEREVVVSAHFSQLPGPAGTVHALLRLIGTHGSVTVDLARPALEVRTAPGATMSLPYGESSVVATLRHLGAVARGEVDPEPPEDLITLARALDAIGESAATTRMTTLRW